MNLRLMARSDATGRLLDSRPYYIIICINYHSYA